jgi:hypothetical protein
MGTGAVHKPLLKTLLGRRPAMPRRSARPFKHFAKGFQHSGGYFQDFLQPFYSVSQQRFVRKKNGDVTENLENKVLLLISSIILTSAKSF